METPCFVITTAAGAIPYSIDIDKPFFRKPRKIFLDDFLFKDSYYDKGLKAPISKFIGCEEEVLVGFREKPGILKSKKGNYKLTKDAYEKVIASMNPSSWASYDTGKLEYNGFEVVEPKDLQEFNILFQAGSKVFGTNFINELTLGGKVVYIEDSTLLAKDISDTDFEYVKYMLTIQEMGAYTFISEMNYKTLDQFFAKAGSEE